MGKGESGCGAPGDGTSHFRQRNGGVRRPAPGTKPEEAWRQAFLTERAQDWMLAQDRKRQWQVTLVKPGVWRIDDYFTASCYLVEGTEKKRCWWIQAWERET